MGGIHISSAEFSKLAKKRKLLQTVSILVSKCWKLRYLFIGKTKVQNRSDRNI